MTTDERGMLILVGRVGFFWRDSSPGLVAAFETEGWDVELAPYYECGVWRPKAGLGGKPGTGFNEVLER